MSHSDSLILWNSFMARKVGSKVIFKKPSKKAVKFDDEISAEHVAVLLIWMEDFAKKYNFDPSVDMDDLEECCVVLNDTMTVNEFEAYFETERGKGYLTGLLTMAIGIEEFEIAEVDEEGEFV